MVVWPGAFWATADVARGWANGLEACGADVIRFRLDQRIGWLEDHLADGEDMGGADLRRMAAETLTGAVYTHKPDLIVVIDGKDIPPETWHTLRTREKVVLVHTESPYEDSRIESMHWCADVHLVNDTPGVERLRRHTPHAFYVPHAYDPTIHHPGNGQPRSGVVFVGSGFAGRARFLAQIDWANVAPLTLAGQWGPGSTRIPTEPTLVPHIADLPEPLPNEQAADLYRTHRMGLNLYRTDHTDPDVADGWAVGPREVEMAACGLFFARQSRTEGDGLFPMLPTFATPEELADLAVWWLHHHQARKEAAAAACAAVADRTFTRHAAVLLQRVG